MKVFLSCFMFASLSAESGSQDVRDSISQLLVKQLIDGSWLMVGLGAWGWGLATSLAMRHAPPNIDHHPTLINQPSSSIKDRTGKTRVFMCVILDVMPQDCSLLNVRPRPGLRTGLLCLRTSESADAYLMSHQISFVSACAFFVSFLGRVRQPGQGLRSESLNFKLKKGYKMLPCGPTLF